MFNYKLANGRMNVVHNIIGSETTMARRSDHSREELTEMALAASARIVAKKGSQALTARAVAAAIGYSPGTLYLVFHNLDDLIFHLNARTLDELGEKLYEAATWAEGPGETLRVLARAYIRFARDNPHRWNLVFTHHLADTETAPAFYQSRVDTLFSGVEEVLAPLGAGSLAHAASSARALWGGVHGICALGLNGKLRLAGGVSMESLADILVNNFLTGYMHGHDQAT